MTRIILRLLTIGMSRGKVMAMQQAFSKLRLRQVRSREQQADRSQGDRRLLSAETLRPAVGVLALVLGLWLMSPAGGGQSWDALLAKAGALAVIGFGGRMLLKVVAPEAGKQNATWLLMLAMVLFSLTLVRLTEWLAGPLLQPWLEGRVALYAAPHASAPLLVAMLYGGPVALVIGLIVGVAQAVGAEINLGVFLLSLCATAVAAREAPRLLHRSTLLRAVGRIALWQTPVVLIMAILTPQPPPLGAVAARLATLYVALFFSGVLTLWLLPLAERFTGHTSLMTLNRFADLSNPLLQRMSLEAPGTYHHSMMVANLAQAAADRIGANGLLARVGAYYHDIGKMGRPGFYMENQMQRGNPHDNMPPNISRMIIENHVKEGLCLARLHRLPPPLMRMISTHHGTSVIRWFHDKARAMKDESNDRSRSTDSVEHHYRYNGPTPVGREESILALADGVEAASRSLPKVTSSRLEGLVNSVVQARWLDGQLDHSLLTNADLAETRKSFVFTLTHLLHARLAYPSDDKNSDSKPAKDQAPAP